MLLAPGTGPRIYIGSYYITTDKQSKKLVPDTNAVKSHKSMACVTSSTADFGY